MASEEEDFDPYRTLNVTPDASIEDIQESFKKLSRTFHPDKNSTSLDPDTKEISRQQFEAITRAKEILCDRMHRQAYDHFGAKGVDMMQRNVYNELKSLQIGKQYRNDDAVHHLLKYYLKREATVDLSKLISCHGHSECAIDATSLYDEFVDLVFRHETIPQFVSNVWNGLPTLQIVINEPEPTFEPVKVVPDDYDFDAEEQLYNEMIEEEPHDLSISELMTRSVEEQVSIIQEALNSGDVTILKGIPVERQSVSPTVSSFLLSLGYQYEYDDSNTFLLSSTQYNQYKEDNVYQSVNLEWHTQFNRFTKLVSLCSIGVSSLSSQLTVSRTIDPKTNVDVALYFNFLDPFWKTFWKLFTTNPQSESESAADLFENKNIKSNEGSGNHSYLRILPELLTVAKHGMYSIWNFIRNGCNCSYDYPGFDVSFRVQRVLFNEWMGISSIRLGRSPSFSWNVLKNVGPKHWTLKMNLGRNLLSLFVKHSKKLQMDDTLRFYIGLQLDLNHLLKFEFGFNKLWIDTDIKDMMQQYDDSKEVMASNIDVSTSFGIDISLKQGLFVKMGVHRGPSQFNLPIKLSEAPSSLKHILLSCTIPLLTYYGYKRYYKPYSVQSHHNKIKKGLNERGLALHHKRQFALKQQSIMMKESTRIQSSQSANNGLVILCALYGDDVERKVWDAIRIYKNLDDDDDDEEDSDNDEEEKKAVEEETADGTPLFNIYNESNENNNNNTNKQNKSKMYLKDIDWLSMESDLQNIMRMNPNEDLHLLSFINVRLVLQYMVDDNKSTLKLSSGTKSYLPGFYDCCPDSYSTKQLFVIYKFDNDQYRYVTISDMFPLTLPNTSHMQWFNCRDVF
eukprot:189162_1